MIAKLLVLVANICDGQNYVNLHFNWIEFPQGPKAHCSVKHTKVSCT